MNILPRLSEIQELPTLPEILFKVQALVNSEDSDAAALARIIQQDPSLTSKILKVANSSYFGPTNQRISSLPLTIARLGFNEVRNIVTAISLIRQFSKKSSVLDYKAFWRHSLSAAFLTQKIAEVPNAAVSPEDRQSCFIAGLLHDIGILVYDQFFHREFEEILSYAIRHEKSFLSAELAVAGKETHPVLGAALLEIWKLDQPVISGVRFHHRGWEKAPDPHRNVASVACLAEYILCNCALGSFEGSYQEMDGEILGRYGAGSETMAELFKYAETEVEKSDLIVAMGMAAGKGPLRRI